MDIKENNDIDSQFISENIRFLNGCFDNSFALQSSLQIVKEHSFSQHDNSQNRSRKFFKKTFLCSQSTFPCNTSRNAPNKFQVKNSKRRLKDWGLPPEIARKYEEKGITEMFDWQVNCLANPKILFDFCNLVYSAPTSAGKTLVAEILAIKTILERQKKVLIILPFVSIVREKMFYLQDILSSSGIRVEGFIGSQSPPGGLQAVHIAICTIEKANSLVNKHLDEGSISDIGAVIVDELHLLGDPSRGYILELLLTKIKYVSHNSDDKIQIVGMSATLPNLEVLAKWLNAELYITTFRPIPLEEYCLVGNQYYNKLGICVGNLDSELCVEGDNVIKICLNTIKDGCSVLIFCMTKNWCENLAQSVANSFYKLGCEDSVAGSILRSQLKSDAIAEVLEQLKNCPVGLDQVLKKTISFGAAYHHAGLTFDERDIIEGGFKSGAIRVLVATSTLSSGVNLPARKVIIRSPLFQRQPINILTYKQMIGRAGRMGRDTKGESILICTDAEKKVGFDLLMGALDPVESCIQCEDKYMRAVLEMIASQVLSTKEQLELYSKCTLLYNQQHLSASQNSLIEETLKELQNYELIRIQSENGIEQYVATPLGKACLSSSMPPNDGLSLFCELQKARQCLVLETDLHLIYLVTPYSVSSQWANMDWLHLLTLWESLPKAMKRVGELVGVQESFIIRCLRGNNKSVNIQNKMNIHKRFYTALALQDLVNEVPLTQVAVKFQCARGFLQSLQQGAATFAGMVTAFSRQLGWKNMEMLISQFQDRLHFGIHSELLELMKLSSLNGTRARTLFDSGFETISSIASAEVNTIENILHKSVPFQSEKAREDDDKDDMKKRNKMKNIWITGYCGMTTKEAAENLIKEARKHLSLEIGVAEIKWDYKIEDTSEILETSQFNTVNENNDAVSSSYQKIFLENKNKIKTDNLVNSKSLSNKKEELSTITKTSLRLSPSTENITHELCKSGFENNNDKDERKEPSEINTNISINENNYIQNSSAKDDIIRDSLNFTDFVLENNVTADKKEPSQINTNIMMKENTSIKNFSAKDDIIWDSLNFTDGVLENVTKVHTYDKTFSPNISFGEFEKSITTDLNTPMKQSSVGDLSLFSSEEENSSLFEESLAVDLIPSKLFDRQPTILDSKRYISEYSIVNSSTFLDAFKSTLIEVQDLDEDIKLVYDEDNKIETEEIKPKTKEIIEINDSVSNKRRQNFNTDAQPFSKKKKTENNCIESSNTKLLRDKISITIKSSLSKVFTLEFNRYKIKCYVLRENDIIANHTVIEDIPTASIYLYMKKINGHNEIIGSDIIKHVDPGNNVTNNKVSPLQGMSIYFNEFCLYLDFTSIGDVSTIKNILDVWIKKGLSLQVMSSKNMFTNLRRYLQLSVSNEFTDIMLIEWLINCTEKVPDLHCLTKKYCGIDMENMLLKIDGEQKRYKSLDTVVSMCLRAWCIWMIREKQQTLISENLQHIEDVAVVENQIVRILSNCEYYGITVDKELASRLLIDVKNSQQSLERRAYKLCGYHFNFNSSKDVAKALGIYNGRRVSTKKSVLSTHNTPLSSVVIYWRKLNSILTKTLYPLTEQACIYTEGNRINPSYTMFTCSGRISMHEPNLQNVPRTFCIPTEYLSEKPNNLDATEFNCRNIFKPASGYIMVSADYCQLEMRILTHFSRDDVLLRIMNSDEDVFKSIAAAWGNVAEDEVDDDLRQKAKQLCYGIIYGMGNRTLGTHLDVTELEAAVFMDTFYKSYPAVKVFTQAVKDECRQRGYVETITKRRRYLPDINSNVPAKKSAAERQAVNTMIQGSAADIAKTAMCSIDNKIEGMVPRPRLILQMHDELIYEVPQYYKQTFIAIMKQVMQETVKLTVPLPVKVKSGRSWGELKEVIL